MTRAQRITGFLGLILMTGVAAATVHGWGAPATGSHAATGAVTDAPATPVEVTIGGDNPSDATAPTDAEVGCTTGCSLKKHHIPPFGRGDFARARHAYAAQAPDAASEAVDTLLFYGVETRRFLSGMGPGRMSPAHVAFLERELARDHAIVSIRMVDDAGGVRVAYGPQRVPIGIKQHLHPVDHDLQPLEFNGTVMRTGVNYLWSRY